MSFPSFPFPLPGADDHGNTPASAGAIQVGSGVLPDGTPVDGGVAAGLIEALGDEDWFAVDLAAGESYQFEVLGATNGGGDLADPVLIAYDASGTPVAQNDDFVTTGPDGSPMVDLDPLLGFTAPASGTYYLGASAYGEAAGSYTVAVLGEPGTLVPLPVAGVIDDLTSFA